MTVVINGVRKAVEIAWDNTEVSGGMCHIKAENAETGDASTKGPTPNDGFAVLTYPLDYVGESNITVTGDEGGTDTGTIVIGEKIEDFPDVPDGGTDPPLTIWGPGDPYPDIGFPDFQPHPDQGLPEGQPHPDHELPGDQPKPDHELPGDQPVVDPR
jgi:hypothetical protein